jgi:hypothetical protein
MSIVVRYAPASVTAEKYDAAVHRTSEALGEDLPDGCDYHIEPEVFEVHNLARR